MIWSIGKKNFKLILWCDKMREKNFLISLALFSHFLYLFGLKKILTLFILLLYLSVHK